MSRVMRTSFFVLLFLLMSAAFSYPDFGRDWRGYHESTIKSYWGTPDLEFNKPNGSSILIYHIVTSRTYPSHEDVIGVNMSQGRPIIVMPTSQIPSQQSVLSLKCTVKFELDKKGVVVSKELQGNGCH